MIEPASHLRCIACEATYDATEIRYRCDCGDLLEVKHDLNRLVHEHGDLKALFEERLGTRRHPLDSGVWRYREIILPDLPQGRIVSCGEGNTTLYHTPLLRRSRSRTAG
ncbi:MAG: hypothetical protein ACYTGR_20075 [Planctomycetota bacterium]|jgi:threonine synthase